ncbi:catechol 2,3-dioxygenase [Pseudorhizobium tarimense]|uniref:Catechol 2,3-dioxygenase n=1 Tax=Pseudorhizobium tarimense TaxID=1079109 RepID=A0ABV2H0H7_9HYPH|nr:VOC family protein [Pseudorhizobium tarimense]MCJ8517377.1 VOC family protein [Pseudorhizobium tarimense]
MNAQNLPFALTRPVHAAHVRLLVSDLDLVSRYYQTMIGLALIENGREGHVLGAGGEPLLTLVHMPGAKPAPRGTAGLFHTAFLVPDRRELSRWLSHAAELDVRLEGASDHLVSEAVYVSDPEGNGIEIYRDRRPNEWRYNEDGTVQMATGRLNLHELLASAPDEKWRCIADGTMIGHIHLKVGNLPKAERFYCDVMGLKVMARYPGASFFATGGYHHHLAANIWNSRGAAARADGMTGLGGYTLHFHDQQALDAVLKAAASQEISVERTAEGHRLTDPWGIEVTLSS